MPPKKRKISGLSGIELSMAYSSLLNLKKAIIYQSEDVGSAEVQAPSQKGDMFDEQLEGMIRLMQSKLSEPQVRCGFYTWLVSSAAVVCLFQHDHENFERRDEYYLCGLPPSEEIGSRAHQVDCTPR